jgi:hypothetical protein
MPENDLDPITIPGVQPQVLSPSPVPGKELPQRRAEDVKSYTGEWTVLLLGILGWATTFFIDASQNETWAEITSPKFMALHVGQLFSVMTAIIAAKRMK